MLDTLLTGQIQDYKDGEGMLVNEVLFQRINTSIEACQSRLDSFNTKMEGNWKVKLLTDLSRPYAMLDQVGMNTMDKRTVLTNEQKLEQQVVEL